MAEQTFWILAAIVIIIVVAVALLGLFGGQLNPFKIFTGKGSIQAALCRELMAKGCTNAYIPYLETEKSNILYDEIGQSLRDKNNRGADVNRATFGEVCAYLGFSNFDECLKNCNCLVS